MTLWTVAHQTPLSMGSSRQEYWSGSPFSSPGDLSDLGIKSTSLGLLHWQAYSLPLSHEGILEHIFCCCCCCCCCEVASVVSDSVRPQRWQPTRLCHPWDSPGKNTGVGCHFLLQCMKVKSEREVAQSCPTLSNSMDCSPPDFSIHGIFPGKSTRGTQFNLQQQWTWAESSRGSLGQTCPPYHIL